MVFSHLDFARCGSCPTRGVSPVPANLRISRTFLKLFFVPNYPPRRQHFAFSDPHLLLPGRVVKYLPFLPSVILLQTQILLWGFRLYPLGVDFFSESLAKQVFLYNATILIVYSYASLPFFCPQIVPKDVSPRRLRSHFAPPLLVCFLPGSTFPWTFLRLEIYCFLLPAFGRSSPLGFSRSFLQS